MPHPTPQPTPPPPPTPTPTPPPTTPTPEPTPTPPPILDPADSNDTFATAKDIRVDFRARSNAQLQLDPPNNAFPPKTFAVGDNDPKDYFKFNLQTIDSGGEDVDWAFELSLADLGANVDLAVYEWNDSLDQIVGLVGSSRQAGNNPESINISDLSSGDYVIEIVRQGSGTTTYTLTASALPATADPYGPDNELENAREITLAELSKTNYLDKENYTDFVGGADSGDFFKIVIPEGGGYISVDIARDESDGRDIDGNATTNLDLELIPLDGAGNPITNKIVRSARPGDKAGEAIAGAFDPGTYVFRVNAATSDEGAFYNLNVAAFSTLERPILTRDIRLEDQSSNATSLTDLNGTLYFVANDGDGPAIWRSNGTFETTEKVGKPSGMMDIGGELIDINVRSFGKMVNVEGVLYFVANVGNVGRELWKYDGIEFKLVKDINPGGESALNEDPDFTVIGDSLFFTANNGVNDEELWMTSNSLGEDAVLINIAKDDAGVRASDPSDFAKAGNYLYFTAEDAAGKRELYRTDPSTALNADPDSRYTVISDSRFDNPGDLFVVEKDSAGSDLYFEADDSLWRIANPENAAVGTIEAISGAVNFGRDTEVVSFRDTFYFTQNNGLWRVGASSVEQIIDPTVSGAPRGPAELTVVGDRLFFKGTDENEDIELWISDGELDSDYADQSGTYLLKDIYAGSSTNSSAISNLTTVGGVLYFTANGTNDEGNEQGIELWRSDGTTDGTRIVNDLLPSKPVYDSQGNDTGTEINNGSAPSNLVNIGERLFFSADVSFEGPDPDNPGRTKQIGPGEELWVVGVKDETANNLLL
ncbi:MAG: hypothetical protein ACFB8W_13675 [Elainellaceae cyanobacterium]